MFQGITHLMLYQNPNVSFPDVVRAILNGNPFDWVRKALDSDCIAAKEQIASFYGNKEKNVSAVYDTLTTAMVHFSNLLFAYSTPPHFIFAHPKNPKSIYWYQIHVYFHPARNGDHPLFEETKPS